MNPWFKKVISGGQTGIDILGLVLANKLGIPTGGTIGRLANGKYHIEYDDGIDRSIFGFNEIPSDGNPYSYPIRTKQNVLDSDGTIYFASDADSPGFLRTLRESRAAGKHFYKNPTDVNDVADWIKQYNIHTLNIAGNRGSKMTPEMEQQATDILTQLFNYDFNNEQIPESLKQLYTSYYGNPDLKNKIVFPISRTIPKGYTGETNNILKDLLSPSWELLNGYKNGTISPEQYTEIYNNDVLAKNGPKLIELINNGKVPAEAIMTCWEKPEDFCHRQLVAKYLNNNGFNVTELAKKISNNTINNQANKLFNIINADILSSPDNYIVQQVNNKGVMGAGLAKQIRQHIKDEDFINKYMNKVNKPEALGSILPIQNKDKLGQMFLNLVGQDSYGYNGIYTDYNALQKGLNTIKDIVPEGEGISFPYGMGAGLAGGDWNKIQNMITDTLGQSHKVNFYKLEAAKEASKNTINTLSNLYFGKK